MDINKIWSVFFIGCLCLYLVTDIIHFYSYRLDFITPYLSEAFWENKNISYIKWSFAITIIIGLTLNVYGYIKSYFLISNSSIAMVMLYILKGSLKYPIQGSIFATLGLLEVCSLSLFFIANIVLRKKYNISKNVVYANLTLFTMLSYLLFMNLSPF